MSGFRHRRYRILGLLGEGGMGRVHLAEDLLADGARVALKAYPPGTAAEILRREFLALRELRHPGIARAFHFGTCEATGAPFFTMEYIAGDPLDRHLAAAGPTTAAAAPGIPAPALDPGRLLQGIDLFIQAADAVGHLHRRGILHLDLKPSNLLVLEVPSDGAAHRSGGHGARAALEPLLILIDFGLIRSVLEPNAEGPRRGTLPFMAPECLDAGIAGPGAPDVRTDIYALGVTFYLALTGRYPFEGRSLEDWIRLHRSEPPARAPELPRSIDRILRCAMAKDPRRRFSGAGALAAALRSARRELAPSGRAWRPGTLEPELVGREREIDQLLRRCERGRGQEPLLAITGPEGMGKTRILDALEARLELDGRATICISPGAGSRGTLLDEVVRRCAVLHPEALRPKRDDPGGRLLACRVGLTAPDPSTRRLLEATASEDLRTITRRIAARRIGRLLREEPLLLLLDDLDLAEPEGKEFIAELAVEISSLPSGAIQGGIICTFEGSPDSLDPFRALAAAKGAKVSWITLGPLSLGAARGLIGSLREDEPSLRRPPPAAIHRRTAGNPLYIIEEIRSCGQGAPRTGKDHLGDRARSRLAILSGPRRSLVQALGLLGRPAGIEILAPCAALGTAEAARAARELAAAGIIAGGARGGLRFVHPSLAEAARHLSPKEEEAGLHLRIARALAPQDTGDGQDSPTLAAETAQHLLAAGLQDEAMALARKIVANEGMEAPGHPAILAVLEAAARIEGPATEAGRHFLEALGDRLDHAGRFDAARRIRQDLAGRRGIGPGERARHLRKLASLCHRRGDTEEAERRLRAAIGVLGISPPPDDALARAPDLCGKGRLAPAGGSPSTLCEGLAVLAELALLFHFRQEPVRARTWSLLGIQLFQRAVEKPLKPQKDAQSASILQRAIDLHCVAGQIAIRTLELDEAAGTLEEGLRLARSAGSPVNLAVLLNNLGLTRHLQSRFREALAAFRTAEKTALDLGDGAALVTIRCNIAQIQAKLGRFAQAHEALASLDSEPALAQSGRLRLSWLYTRALVLALQGDPEADWDAVAQAAGALADRFLQGFAAVYQSEAAMGRGEWTGARKRLRNARGPASGRIRESRSARIEAALGHRGKALAALARYRAGTERLPGLVDAWNRLHVGQALSDLGDLEAGRMEIQAAESYFASHGAVPGAVEAGLLLADVDLRRAAADPALKALGAALARLSRLSDITPSPLAGGAPGTMALRRHLLLARARMRTFLQGGGRDILEEIRDILAAAGGGARSGESGELLLVLEALQAALGRLDGDPLSEEEALRRLDAHRRRISKNHSAADRKAYLGIDIFGRIGLGEFSRFVHSAGSAARPWPVDGWRIIDGLLRSLSRNAPPAAETFLSALGSLLADLGRCLAAHSIRLVAPQRGRTSKILLEWSAPGSEAPSPLEAGWKAPAIARSRIVGPGALRLECPVPWAGAVPAAILADQIPADPVLCPGRLDLLEAFARILALARCPPAWTVEGTPALPSKEPDSRTIHPPTEPVQVRTRTLDLPDRLSRIGLVGESPALRRIERTIAAAASVDLPVLITGESGTGKELVARAIHRLSERAQGPFISQNCTAIPAGLFEADLFGSERGAFTGADRTRSGFIRKAQGGTFLLDEIGDADLSSQAKILRVIEEKALRPVGGTRSVPIDVRFMATTQKDIDLLVEGGGFRGDLFYRIAGLRIHIPPLRERREDIRPLLIHSLRGILRRDVRLAPHAMTLLEGHSWPGNVRELEAVARRIALELGDEGRTVPKTLVQEVLSMGVVHPDPAGALPPGILQARSYQEVRTELEKEHLRSLWNRFGGDLGRMAAELETTVRSVYRRFERLGLQPKSFRKGRP